jgi:hypothetical protein
MAEPSQTLIKEVAKLNERLNQLKKDITALKRAEKQFAAHLIKQQAKVQTIGAIGKFLYIATGFAAGLISAYATYKGLK